MGNLVGAEDLKARLKAIQLMFKPYGKKWADTAVELAQPKIPTGRKTKRGRAYAWGDKHDPGRLRRSVRRKSATQLKATVVGHYTAYFVDHGVAAHSMSPRIKGENKEARAQRTVFHKKHPGYRARPFRGYMTHEAKRRNPMAVTLIDEWNKAAGRR